MGDLAEAIGALADPAALQQLMPYAALALLLVALVVRLKGLVDRGQTIATALLDFGRGAWTRFEGSVVGALIVVAFFLLGIGLGVRLAYDSAAVNQQPPAVGVGQGPPSGEAGEGPAGG